MSNNVAGIEVVNNANDLFAGRAVWVQKWILLRAVPFLSLLAIVLIYALTISDKIAVPDILLLNLGYVIALLVGLRTVSALCRKRWIQVFGNYQVTLFFLAFLLVFGSLGGTVSDYFWVALLVVFWLIGLANTKHWYMPGEFLTVVLLMQAATLRQNMFDFGWLFVSCAFAPVMVRHLFKRNQLKLVIIMAALLLGYWMLSDIEGWLIFPAIAGAMLLLGLAIYSVLKLKDSNASSVIQSIALAVISGLLLFVAVGLLAFDSSEAVAWWVMLPVFLGILGFIYSRHGQQLIPLLLLWATHWIVITVVTTLGGVLGAGYGLPLTLLGGSYALRRYACAFNNHRLLVWARVYMAVCALSLDGAMFSEDYTLIWLVLVLLLFIFAFWLASPITLDRGAPWWKGAVNPRHIVAIRRVYRKSGNIVSGIPIVGPTAAAVIISVRVMTKLKQEGRSVDSGDLLMICWVWALSLFLVEYVDLYLISNSVLEQLLVAAQGEDPAAAIGGWRVAINAMAVFMISGFLLTLINRYRAEPIYALLAMASFVAAPFSIPSDSAVMEAPVWAASFISAISIICIRHSMKKG